MYCEKEVCGKIILPCDSPYNAARQVYNRSIQRYPGAIVYCRTVDEISQAIRWAKRCGVAVRVRGGGHNYQGFSVGNGALVIDTSCFKDKTIDTRRGIVRIGSGIINEELYALAGSQGYPFPSGTCPTVGAAGLTFGGGWGYSASMYGLTCDSLLEVEMVDAKGDLVQTSRCSHPDLFWAMRGGGGGNFGVATSLTYRLPRPFFDVTYVNILYPRACIGTAERYLCTWQEWLSTADYRFSPNSRIYNSREDGRGIFLRGIYYGTPPEAYRALRAFLRIPGAEPQLTPMTFPEAARTVAATYPPFQRFRFIGRFVHRRYTPCEIESIIRLIGQRPPGSDSVSVALYALGGRVRDIAPRETAFFYKNADYIMGLEASWDNPAFERDNIVWLLPRARYLRGITCGSYINFPYQPTPQYMAAYYGENACRLRRIKCRYDPCDVFRFPQSIR